LLHGHSPADVSAAAHVVRTAHVAGMADSFKLSAVLGALLEKKDRTRVERRGKHKILLGNTNGG
jgi:hypothetical protein